MLAVRAKRKEVNMIHLGDITKIHGDKVEPWTASHSEAPVKICPLLGAGRDLRENDLDFSWRRFGS